MFCLRKSTEIKLLYLISSEIGQSSDLREGHKDTQGGRLVSCIYSNRCKEAFKMETEKRVNEIKESFDGLLKKFETYLNKTLNTVYD